MVSLIKSQTGYFLFIFISPLVLLHTLAYFPCVPRCRSSVHSFLHKRCCQPLSVRKYNDQNSLPPVVTGQLDLQPSFCLIFSPLFSVLTKHQPTLFRMWRSSRRNTASDSSMLNDYVCLKQFVLLWYRLQTWDLIFYFWGWASHSFVPCSQ